MNPSSISVIIPNYNHAQYISGQLSALVNQSVRPLEIIVIDDCSTDGSIGVIEEFVRQDSIVRLIRHERNMGVVATLNRGLKEARGEYFYGGAADDLVGPSLIECTERLIARYPEAGLYFGNYRGLRANDQESCDVKVARWDTELYASPERFLNEYLEVEHCTNSPSPTTVYRKRYIEDLGGFRPELGHWCDTFLIRAIGLKYGAGYTPTVQASVRWLTDSYSSTQSRKIGPMLDIVARAAYLMRSPALSDRFPEEHVARWEKGYRDHVILGYLYNTKAPLVRSRRTPPPDRAEGMPDGKTIPPWFPRFWSRAILSYHWRRWQAYVPDLSCYMPPTNRGTASQVK